MSRARQEAEHLTHLLRELSWEYLGRVDGSCRETALLLCYRLWRAGISCGIASGLCKSPECVKLYGPQGEAHAYLLALPDGPAGELLALDPTREQFQPDYDELVPRSDTRVVLSADEAFTLYGPARRWAGWSPPPVPSREAVAFLSPPALALSSIEPLRALAHAFRCPEMVTP